MVVSPPIILSAFIRNAIRMGSGKPGSEIINPAKRLRSAFDMLERIQEDPQQAEVLIKGTEYIRVELQETAQRD
jgi:hypothetical protein